VPTQTHFKEILDEVFNKQSQAGIDRELQKTFWGFLQNFIDRMPSGSRGHLQKNTRLSQNTIKNVRNLKNHLQEYQRISRRLIEFNTIDMIYGPRPGKMPKMWPKNGREGKIGN